jgi:carboxylate-amine ligase
MDAQTRVTDVAALAALVQCLVRCRAAQPRTARPTDPEVLAENRFLAARDGMRAQLIHGSCAGRRSVRDVLEELLEACQPFAEALGCTTQLNAAAALSRDPGDVRQRRLAARAGLVALPSRLGAAFATTGAAVAAA